MAKQERRAFQITSRHAAVFFAAITACMFPKLLLGIAYPWGDLLEMEIPYRIFTADCFRTVISRSGCHTSIAVCRFLQRSPPFSIQQIFS